MTLPRQHGTPSILRHGPTRSQSPRFASWIDRPRLMWLATVTTLRAWWADVFCWISQRSPPGYRSGDMGAESRAREFEYRKLVFVLTMTLINLVMLPTGRQTVRANVSGGSSLCFWVSTSKARSSGAGDRQCRSAPDFAQGWDRRVRNHITVLASCRSGRQGQQGQQGRHGALDQWHGKVIYWGSARGSTRLDSARMTGEQEHDAGFGWLASAMM